MTTEIYSWSHSPTEHHGPAAGFTLGPFDLEPGEYSVKADMAVTVERQTSHTERVVEVHSTDGRGHWHTPEEREVSPETSTWEAVSSSDHFALIEPGTYRLKCSPGKGHVTLNSLN